MCYDQTKCRLGRLIHERMEQMQRNDALSEDMGEAAVLGLMMSEHFRWSGLPILKAASAALEDANFHLECELVEQMIRNIRHGFNQ